MVCNHLPDDDLVDCIVFCKHHCLLAMTEEQRVSQLVVWKEVSTMVIFRRGCYFVCLVL